MIMEDKIEVSVENLQKLIRNFYKVCAFCDELNIYEYEDLDQSMQEMKEWADENFGRELKKIK